LDTIRLARVEYHKVGDEPYKGFDGCILVGYWLQRAHPVQQLRISFMMILCSWQWCVQLLLGRLLKRM
jgi:hypothetical protein